MKTTPSIIQFPSPTPAMKPPFNPFKKAAILIGTLAIAGNMISCNTVAGLGRDTQKVGNKIEQKAHEVAR